MLAARQQLYIVRKASDKIHQTAVVVKDFLGDSEGTKKHVCSFSTHWMTLCNKLEWELVLNDINCYVPGNKTGSPDSFRPLWVTSLVIWLVYDQIQHKTCGFRSNYNHNSIRIWLLSLIISLCHRVEFIMIVIIILIV